MSKTKLDKKFIDALTEVVDSKDFYILTDEELIFSVNELLGDEFLSIDAFKSYKTARRGTNSEYYDEFVHLIKKGLIREKRSLVKKLQDEDKAWQKYAWILERKFEDFNKLDKTKNDNDNKHSGEVTIIRKVI
jgi:hypothetical protein